MDKLFQCKDNENANIVFGCLVGFNLILVFMVVLKSRRLARVWILEEEIDMYKKENLELNVEKYRCYKDMVELIEKTQNQKLEIGSLKDLNNDYEKVISNNNDTIKHLEEYKTRHSSLRKDSLVKQNKDLETENTRLQTQYMEIQSDNKNLMLVIEKLETENDKLRGTGVLTRAGYQNMFEQDNCVKRRKKV